MTKTIDAEDIVRRVLTEDVLTLPQARTQIQEATGQRPDKATIHRWILRGTKGVKLEAVKLGNSWITSTQAIHRYITAVTKASLS